LILKNKACWVAYIRGIFDTDGSLYLKKANCGKYREPVVDIASLSQEHLTDIKSILQNLSFRFWMEKTKIRMAGWANTKRFFKEIKPQNPTQKARFRIILNLYSIKPALRNKVYQTTLKRDLAKI
jgi:intein/homing endonuclease